MILPARRAPLPSIGAQVVIERGFTAEEVRAEVVRMAERGLTILRFFASWDLLEPRQGEWRWDIFDGVFEEAAARGMRVVPTLMAYSPPGWMRTTSGLQDIGDLEDPGFRRAAKDYVRRLVTRWRGHEALDSWILWNEPSRQLERNPATLRLWRRYLKRASGGDIAALNRRHYHQHDDFEQVGRQQAGGYGVGFGGYAERLDWLRFSVDRLGQVLGHLAGQVRRLDPVHPVHVNPHRMGHCLAEIGQLVWAESEIVDFMGCSAHPPWHSTRFAPEHVSDSVGFFCDLASSASRDPAGRMYLTELQAGPTIFSAFHPSAPTPADLRQWIWEGIGAGAEAVIFWCWNPRRTGYEAAEWSLVGADGSDSPRMEEVGRIAAALARHQDVLTGLRPSAPDALILWSDAAQVLGLVEGEGEDPGHPRNRHMVTDAACGAFLFARDQGWNTRFVSESLLRSWVAGGRVDDPRLQRLFRQARTLLVPGCLALEAGTLRALEALARQGWLVVADGLAGWKDPDGAISPANLKDAEGLFGAAVREVVPQGRGRAREAGSDDFEWYLRLRLEPAGALAETEVRANWSDGSAAVTLRRYPNNGAAARLGTVFFQRYFREPDRLSEKDLGELLPELKNRAQWECDAPGHHLRWRILEGEDHCVAVIANRSTEARPLGRLRRQGEPARPWTCLESGREADPGEALEPGAVAVLVQRRE